MRIVNGATIIAAAVAFVGMNVAFAQTQTAPAEPAPAVDVQTGGDVTLSMADMLATGREVPSRMEQHATVVREQLKQARQSRDVVKVLCLNDALSQLNVAVRSSHDRLSSLENAASANDEERTRHEFTILQVLEDRGRALVEEAALCIGDEGGYVGESTLTFNVDPGIPDEDPAAPDDTLLQAAGDTPVTSSPTL